MDLVTKVAAAMQSTLGPALDQLGRQAGVIRRQRKFTGASLFRTIVLTLMRAPSPRTDHFVSTAAMLHLGVTGRAIEKRFDERLVIFLRRGLERTIEHALAADPARVALLEKSPPSRSRTAPRSPCPTSMRTNSPAAAASRAAASRR